MQSIGLIGGTGDLGTALAVHLAKKYETLRVGSRSKDKSEAAIKKILADKKDKSYLKDRLLAATNLEVVKHSDIIIATVPYETLVESIRDLREDFHDGQLLISAAASVAKRGKQFFAPGGNESATIKIREMLPQTVQIASAFQTVPANILYKEQIIKSDVLVTSDDEGVFHKVEELISKIDGLRALWLGNLELSSEIERLTSLLLNIAIKNHLRSPTLNITSF